MINRLESPEVEEKEKQNKRASRSYRVAEPDPDDGGEYCHNGGFGRVYNVIGASLEPCDIKAKTPKSKASKTRDKRPFSFVSPWKYS